MIRYRISDKNTIVLDYFKLHHIFSNKIQKICFSLSTGNKEWWTSSCAFYCVVSRTQSDMLGKEKTKSNHTLNEEKGGWGQWSIVMSISLLSVKIILRKASPKGKAHKNQKRNLVIFYNYHTQKVHMQKIEEHILIR